MRPLFLLTAVALSSTALATTPWANPRATVYDFTDEVHIDVENVSSSLYAGDVVFEVTSGTPTIELSGQGLCPQAHDVRSAGVHFGNSSWVDSYNLDYWADGKSQVLATPGWVEVAEFAFAFPLDFPHDIPWPINGWFNPSREIELAMGGFVSDGGTEVQYLRNDHTIEVQMLLHYDINCVPFYGSWSDVEQDSDDRLVTFFVHFLGNPEILPTPEVVVGLPGEVEAPDEPVIITEITLPPQTTEPSPTRQTTRDSRR